MPEDPNDPVELYRARGPVEANALYAHLWQAGLPVRLDNEHLQGVAGEVPGGWDTALRVLVARARLDEARALLAEFLADARTAAASDPLACLACRAPMGTATACPACGWSYGEPDGRPPTDGATAAPAPPEPAIGTEPATPYRPPDTAGGWGEVAAVLAVGVVQPLLWAADSYFVPPGPPGGPAPNRYLADALQLAGSAGIAAFVTVYLIHRSREPWARFGLGPARAADFPLGLGIMLLTWLVGCCDGMLDRTGLSADRVRLAGPRGPVEAVAMVLMNGVNAFSEEVVTRAYLITRLGDLLGSRGWAVVLAAAAFASYHVYYGPPALVSTFLVGLAYGLVYLGVRRIWPLVFGHALYNILLELAVSSRP